MLLNHSLSPRISCQIRRTRPHPHPHFVHFRIRTATQQHIHTITPVPPHKLSPISLQGIVAGCLMRPVRSLPALPPTQKSSALYDPLESATWPRPRPGNVLDTEGTVPTETVDVEASMQLNMVRDIAHPNVESFSSRIHLRNDMFFEGSLPAENRQAVVSFFSSETPFLETVNQEGVQKITLVDNRNRFYR